MLRARPEQFQSAFVVGCCRIVVERILAIGDWLEALGLLRDHLDLRRVPEILRIIQILPKAIWLNN